MNARNNQISRFVAIFMLWTLVGMLSKLPFIAMYSSLMGNIGIEEKSLILLHGLKLDVAIAGYLTVIPGILLIVSLWMSRVGERTRKTMLCICRTYSAATAFIVTLAITINLGLYAYWGFPLDTTPLFYFLSSPSDALASITLWQAVAGVVTIIMGTFIIYKVHDALLSGAWTNHKPLISHLSSLSSPLSPLISHLSSLISQLSSLSSKLSALSLILLCAALIIPIRGGFSVAVNNVGSVYFSENVRVNHAAVNPVFSFLESMSHSDDLGTMYRFMDDAEADRLFSEMTYTAQRDTTDNVITSKPKHVVIVVLESFSRYIMDDGEYGVRGVTPTLNALTTQGIYFLNFYADSFRTDRGLMSILSGFPAQPTMSLMKNPRLTNNLYSIARSLRKDGYSTEYIYGGDANFTNMRSYLLATGFDRIISEDDFDRRLRTGKWGVNDSVLFARAYHELSLNSNPSSLSSKLSSLSSHPSSLSSKLSSLNSNPSSLSFSVIQTSSSHEPFDVPVKHLADERLNAFHYTDHCLGEFIAQMRQRPEWSETLFLIVPDHLGCYPENIDNFQLYRYQIPMIITGGVVARPQRIETIGSQHDIAATLLGMMGIDHSEFLFSKDLLDPRAPHFSFFAVPDAMGMVNSDAAVIYDNTSSKVVLKKGKSTEHILRCSQAYLQKLYDVIANL